jgi:hypothetical protein
MKMKNSTTDLTDTTDLLSEISSLVRVVADQRSGVVCGYY